MTKKGMKRVKNKILSIFYLLREKKKLKMQKVKCKSIKGVKAER
jgi:hypothetical protein